MLSLIGILGVYVFQVLNYATLLFCEFGGFNNGVVSYEVIGGVVH